MASRFIVCKDKEEAQRMAEAGLLYVSFSNPKQRYVPAGIGFISRWVIGNYGTFGWPPRDFAYLVEEDDACG